tara:strand:+ start:55 stop:516 length:462 start_codon:yes stop_codon:yes gene_type:complete
MSDDDLVAKYAAEAAKSIAIEADKRIKETYSENELLRLKEKSLFVSIEEGEIIDALLARLGSVRAALDGHGGGISLASHNSVKINNETKLDLILDLTGACLSCGAAPGTLQGIKADLESDNEIFRIRYSSNLLDTFDELGREFILEFGNVEFV